MTHATEERVWGKTRLFHILFLAVQNSSIGDLVPCLVGRAPLTIRVFTTLQSDPMTSSMVRLVTFETFDQSDESEDKAIL